MNLKLMILARLIQFFQISRFRRELLSALIVKFSILLLIAAVCFSHPIADHLSKTDLAKRLLTE